MISEATCGMDGDGIGLYIHIPFCRRKCSYCAFYSVATLDDQKTEAYLQALVQEARSRKEEGLFGFPGKIPVNTLYFGGGTPSLLPVGFYERLISELETFFDFSSMEEVTLEANPEHLDAVYLKDLYHYTPVRRLSIGVQSFLDRDLRLLNRCHTGEEAVNAVENARKAGFTDLSIDLIYGLTPYVGSSKTLEGYCRLDEDADASWNYNLARLEDLDLPHFSAYALTVEPGTVLFNKIKKGILPPLQEDLQANEYARLMDFASDKGYRAYEISNFAKEGHEAVHNSRYWKDVPYLGLGPSAHSYTGAFRFWNIGRLDAYLADPMGSREMEELSESDRYHEYVMTGLRTIWGVEDAHIGRFSAAIQEEFLERALEQCRKGNLIHEDGAWKVPSGRRLLTDGIACEFF